MLPSMGSEYATGEGSSFVSAGRLPGKTAEGKTAGLAKQVIDGVREWVGESWGVLTGGRGGGRGKRPL